MITGDKYAYVWPLSENIPISVLGGSGDAEGVSAAAYDPKNRFMVTGSFDGSLRLWRRDMNSAWKMVSEAKAHKYSVSALAVAEGGLVATTDEIAKDVALWSVDENRLVRKWDKSGIGSSQIFAFYFNRDASTIHVTGRFDGFNSRSDVDINRMVGVAGLDVATGDQKPQPWRYDENFVAATSDSSERWVAISSTNGWLSLLDFRTGAHIARIVLGKGAMSLVIDESNRFDTTDLSEIGSLYWSFSDDPIRLQSIDLTMRDYFEPRLLPRLLACRASSPISCDQSFRQVRDLAALNRIQPGVRILSVVRGERPDEAVVTVEASAVDDKTEPNGKTHTDTYDLRLFRDGVLVGQWPEAADGSDEIGVWRQRNSSRARSRFENRNSRLCCQAAHWWAEGKRPLHGLCVQ